MVPALPLSRATERVPCPDRVFLGSTFNVIAPHRFHTCYPSGTLDIGHAAQTTTYHTTTPLRPWPRAKGSGVTMLPQLAVSIVVAHCVRCVGCLPPSIVVCFLDERSKDRKIKDRKYILDFWISGSLVHWILLQLIYVVLIVLCFWGSLAVLRSHATRQRMLLRTRL